MWGTSSAKAQQEDMEAALKQHAVFPRIIAGGDYFFFSHKKGTIIRGKAIISNITYRKSGPLNIKIITLNKPNMGFQNLFFQI